MTGKSFAKIVLLVALAMTVANAQHCNCENLYRCWYFIENVLYGEWNGAESFQISSVYLMDPSQMIPWAINSACNTINAMAEVSSEEKATGIRKPNRKAAGIKKPNRKDQQAFLETSQTEVTEDDIYYCLLFDMDCIIEHHQNEEFLYYNQYYCQNTLREFFNDDYFPNTDGVDDMFARQQYILNAGNWYASSLHPLLECDF